MAYEDLYATTETIPAGEDYWIKIKTSLTHTDKERATRQMHKIEATIDDRGKMHGVVAPDYETYQKLLVAGAIVEWNLDERDGSLWKLSPDTAKIRNIERLPDVVFERVLKRVEALNAEDPVADRAFRDGSGGRTQGHGERTADASEVPVGDESVGTTWDTSVAPG